MKTAVELNVSEKGEGLFVLYSAPQSKNFFRLVCSSVQRQLRFIAVTRFWRIFSTNSDRIILVVQV